MRTDVRGREASSGVSKRVGGNRGGVPGGVPDEALHEGEGGGESRLGA